MKKGKKLAGFPIQLSLKNWHAVQMGGAWLRARARLTPEEDKILDGLPSPDPTQANDAGEVWRYWEGGDRLKTYRVLGVDAKPTVSLLEKVGTVWHVGKITRILAKQRKSIDDLDAITMLGDLARAAEKKKKPAQLLLT